MHHEAHPSRQNPIVAAFRTLADQPDPTGTRLLLDGAHLVNDARSSGLQFETVAVAASRLTSQTEEGLLAQRLEREGIDVIEASDAVFDVIEPGEEPVGHRRHRGPQRNHARQRSVRSRTRSSSPRLTCRIPATWARCFARPRRAA